MPEMSQISASSSLEPEVRQPLPPGWNEYKTDNGTYYYHHSQLGTQWDHPSKKLTSQQPSAMDHPRSTNAIIADDFLSSVSSMFGVNGMGDKQGIPNIEGSIRGGDTPTKGFLSRAMSLQKYFTLTTNDFFLRCASTFTMVQGLFVSGGPSQIQGQMFHDKPDLYAPLWLTTLGSTLFGILPNLSRLLTVGGRSDFADFSAALVAFSLFPIAGVIAYFAGIFSKRREQSIVSSDDPIVPLPVLICLCGYAELPLVLGLPLLMLNSWVFRLLLLIVCLAITLAFFLVAIRGNSDSFMGMTAPRKVQFIALAIVILFPHMTVMMKLPSYTAVIDETMPRPIAPNVNPPVNLAVQVENIINDPDASDALAKVLKQIDLDGGVVQPDQDAAPVDIADAVPVVAGAE